MDKFVQKKYVQHRIKRAFVNANVTIPKIVINKLSNELYVEFTKLSELEQEQVIFSDDLVVELWNKYMDKMNTELLEEI
ncbi:hypothetical protein E0T48_002710 [Enterococcus faecalis]|nr:hypothetical protein [Enterococcus faecalis]EHK9982431.1 hypothetical protein [Enterococcus faecalis]